jgi:hypothetical protein
MPAIESRCRGWGRLTPGRGPHAGRGLIARVRIYLKIMEPKSARKTRQMV